jgi:hypothetical protein
VPSSDDQLTAVWCMGQPTKRRHATQFPIFRESVLRYFAVKENWDAVYPYIAGNRFSRRMYEHFVSDYARSHRCEYYLTDETTGERYLFNVYHSSQSVLHGCHKRHMDPFNRTNPHAENGGVVRVGYGDRVCDVTVSELNCFRWMHRRRVFEYMAEHEEEIRADMCAMARLRRRSMSSSSSLSSSSTTTTTTTTENDTNNSTVTTVNNEDDSSAVSPSSVSLIDEVVIDLRPPQPPSSSSSPSPSSVYWQEATASKKQLPPRQRKRYRTSSVNLVFNDNIAIESHFVPDKEMAAVPT